MQALTKTQTLTADTHAAALTETTTSTTSGPDFYRVLVRKPGATKPTTVSVSAVDYKRLLHFAYGNPVILHAALREAALTLKPQAHVGGSLQLATGAMRKPQDFSCAVRAKALNSLRGSYRPGLLKAVPAAEAQAADENNSAWDGIGAAEDSKEFQ